MTLKEKKEIAGETFLRKVLKGEYSADMMDEIAGGLASNKSEHLRIFLHLVCADWQFSRLAKKITRRNFNKKILKSS